jgi:glycosyltransferase involved in cell wall biosynthesis
VNIFINARFLSQSLTGVQRVATEFVKALDYLIETGQIDETKYSFVLLAPKNIQSELNLKQIPIKNVGVFTGHLWEQVELPFYAKKGLLLCLCNTGPLFKRNQIVVIHDARVFALPQSYSFAYRSWYKLLLPILGRIVKKVITVSSFSKDELVHYCRFNPAKIVVVCEGKEHILSTTREAAILKKNAIGGKPYVLAVSTMTRNKNFQAIVQAVEQIKNADFDVVIVGGKNSEVFGLAQIPLPDFVKHLGYVSDGELRVLYEQAACFVYPSLYEGFGLPPLEAMACGCPVIVSNTTSLPEVCGDATIYCDPRDPTDIASKIEQLVKDKTLQNTMRQKGLERAEQFSWVNTVQQTLTVIEKLNRMITSQRIDDVNKCA